MFYMCTDINMEIGRTSLAFYIKKLLRNNNSVKNCVYLFMQILRAILVKAKLFLSKKLPRLTEKKLCSTSRLILLLY